MKIVAFLQNMWVRNPRTAAKLMQDSAISDRRERMIKYALFAGCKTGRVLRQAFGEDLCDLIIWQEANPTVSTDPKQYFPPDIHHITNVLECHCPDTVLCLTRAGQSDIFLTVKDWQVRIGRVIKFVSAPHPAARGPQVFSDLIKAREMLI